MTNRFDIRGKIILVTGGNGQLGTQWIWALRNAGALAAAIDLPDFDVREHSSMLTALDVFGAPDALICAAAIDAKPGTPGCGPPEEVPLDDFTRTIMVNLVGVQNCIQVFAKPMIEQRKGSIILISSLFGSLAPDHRRYEGLPVPFWKPAAYSASKAGVLGLCRYWAAYLAPFNVRVNAVSPGSMDRDDYHSSFREAFTHDVPMGRFAQPGEFDGVMQWLISDASSYVTGANVFVDGGYSCI